MQNDEPDASVLQLSVQGSWSAVPLPFAFRALRPSGGGAFVLKRNGRGGAPRGSPRKIRAAGSGTRFADPRLTSAYICIWKPVTTGGGVMNILSSIFTDDLAIDLGTVNTLIFAPDRGVVLNEPSAVAIHKYTGEVLEVGREAHKMLGREPKDVDVFRPVRGGTIENFDAVEKMLKAFIARVSGSSHRRSHVVIGVPGSSTSLEQRSVRDAARDAKATRVDLVDEGLCAALGAGLSYEDERAHLVVDIGGGARNVAIVAGGSIVASHSLQAAGNSMDQAIVDYVRAKYEMQLGERSAENLKK